MPPIPGSYWVVPDRLLAGPYPGANTHDRAVAKLEALLDAGIRSFLDLTEAPELDGYEPLLQVVATTREVDVRYRRMSVVDRDIPTVEHMTAVLTHMRSEIDAGRPIYVHCWGGIGRTGTVVGCWIVGQGLTPDAALQRIVELRKETPDRGLGSPETELQRGFIMQWLA
jgi:protein-tyrosine phosphatase